MPVISNTVEMLFNAQDHASRVVGNINTSLGNQLSVFMQIGQKVPLVSRQVSAGMVVATAATERYVRELKELQKFTDLSTKASLAYQHAIEQSGSSYDTLLRFIDKVRDAQERTWKVENQLLVLRLKRFGLLDKEKGIMMDHNELLKKSAEFILKYKEGYDRAKMAQKVFGEGGAALVPILEKIAEANRLTNDRGEDFVKLMETAGKQVEENREVLSELTMAFKDFGVRVSTIVLPILTVLAKGLKILVEILIFVTKPIFAVLRVVAAFIVQIKEVIAVLGIVGKLLLWIGGFVLGFYIRQWLLAIVTHVAAAVSAGKLGQSLTWLGGIIRWVGTQLVNMTFWVQSMIVGIKDWVVATGGWLAALKATGSAVLSLTIKLAILLVKILAVIAVGVILYELFNKLLYAVTELRYQFARLFSDEQSGEMKRLREEINLIQRDIDRWSVEGIWERISNGMGKTNEEAEKLKYNVRETFGLTRDMYDSLGDTLERAINLPANVLPPLMERLKANQETFNQIEQASRSYRRVAAESMATTPIPNLQREGSVKVELKQKVEFDDMGEPVMKTLESLGMAK